MIKKTLLQLFGIGFVAFVILTISIIFVFTKVTDDTKRTINTANLVQLSKAIALYYSDNNSYPPVQGGGQLVHELKSRGYISGQPIDPTSIYYEPTTDGENYSLRLQN